MAVYSAQRGRSIVELPLDKLSLPVQQDLRFSDNATDKGYNHYSNTPQDRLKLRIETYQPLSTDTPESQAFGTSDSSKPTCKITVWCGSSCYCTLDVAEYARNWNHPNAGNVLLHMKRGGAKVLLKALVPLSQLSYRSTQEISKENHLYTRIQLRFTYELDTDKFVDTLKNFCSGLRVNDKSQPTPQSNQGSMMKSGGTEVARGETMQESILTDIHMRGSRNMHDTRMDGAESYFPQTPHRYISDNSALQTAPSRQPVQTFTYRETGTLAESVPGNQQGVPHQGSSPIPPNGYNAQHAGSYIMHPMNGAQTHRQAESSDHTPSNGILAYDTVKKQGGRLGNDFAYNSRTVQPESYTQPETDSVPPMRWPLHPTSSPRAPHGRLTLPPSSSPTPGGRGEFGRMLIDDTAERIHDPRPVSDEDAPLIDLDASTIRINRDKRLQAQSYPPPESLPSSGEKRKYDSIQSTHEHARSSEDAVHIEIRSKTGLYALSSGDLSNVVAEVLNEDGFSNFVRTMEQLWRARIKVDIDAVQG